MPDRKGDTSIPPYESPRSDRPTTAEGTLERPLGKHDPYAAFRFPAFGFYTSGNLISVVGRLMLMVAVEWEIYARTHSATALGLVGLMIALPVVSLSLFAGHIADRYPRKYIVLVTQALSAICSLALALVSWQHLAIPNWAALRYGNHLLAGIANIFERHATYFHFDDRSIPLIYLILLATATARTFGWAARSSYFPQLVPRDAFANAVTWNSSVFQIGSVIGPAVGGFLIVQAGFPFIYVLDAVCAMSFFLLVLPIRSSDHGISSERNAWRSLKEGIRFMLSKKVILATITF